MISRRSVLLLTASMAMAARASTKPHRDWLVGTHYDEVKPPQPKVQGGNVKMEIVEFFWYGCPSCYTLEPHLVLWQKRKPTDVQLVRIPVAWRAERVAHARMYYALRSLQREEEVRVQVFDAIHRLNQSLDTLDRQIAFAQACGIDPKQYEDAYNSTGVQAALQRADTLARGYRIAGVPAVAINGKYTTNLRSAGGSENKLIMLLEHLVGSERA